MMLVQGDAVRIVRVFPRKTSMTPIDGFIGDPPLFRPDADEVHISVTFTWDIEEGYRLRDAWANYYDNVKIGGPAIDTEPPGEFIPRMYVKDGVTITSRGCDRKCPWCLVPEREGRIKLLDIKPGWIVNDNNILMTPKDHQVKVYQMLRGLGRSVEFRGGIDARLVDNWVADQFENVPIKRIYLAADTKYSLRALANAVSKLSFLGRERMSCYVLIAFNGETMDEAEERLKAVWDIGCMPFAQLYQPPDSYIDYSWDWKQFARKWSRPMIVRSINR